MPLDSPFTVACGCGSLSMFLSYSLKKLPQYILIVIAEFIKCGPHQFLFLIFVLHSIIAVGCRIFTDCLNFRTEKGTYYALHLGGTYFRVLRVHLGGQRSYLDVQDVERHPIPSHLMNSTSEVTSLLLISY